MIKEIVKDLDFLTQRSEKIVYLDEATGRINQETSDIINDLIDTAEAHRENCVGLAAPQIGYLKRVIVVLKDGKYIPMINPVIVSKKGQLYRTREGCLSLEGSRETVRNKEILFSYIDKYGHVVIRPFKGYTAQIIQHEVDHLNGVLI